MKKIVAGLILVILLSVSGAAWEPKNSPHTRQRLTSPVQNHKFAVLTDTFGNVLNTDGRTVSGMNASRGQTLNSVRLPQSSSALANGSMVLLNGSKNLHIETRVSFQLRLSESIEN